MIFTIDACDEEGRYQRTGLAIKMEARPGVTRLDLIKEGLDAILRHEQIKHDRNQKWLKEQEEKNEDNSADDSN